MRHLIRYGGYSLPRYVKWFIEEQELESLVTVNTYTRMVYVDDKTYAYEMIEDAFYVSV